ncbi:MAG: hypothetical protein HOL98_04275 [Gammaproteobacteria bacterium]|jgi:hypothetical protein|nr:hypothetical protein [Gammaproteobacteria bacterium]MBT5603886.1 hypothetical protein [Gammaproteobacteria bacterium]MBT6244267.1 hypothetical protein [Gammaproteobacteria bacterium]
MVSDNNGLFDDRINSIESAYEFMLAYAAQGHEKSAGPRPAHEEEIYAYLSDLDKALTDIAEITTKQVEQVNPSQVDSYRAFIDVLANDAKTSQAAVGLLLSQSSISSQLVDNLNASIHLRALLTDLFIVDEALG